MSEEWSHPEIVRALQRIEKAQGETNKKLDQIHTAYVPRELWRERNIHVDRRLDEQGRAITDVQADIERHHKDHQTGSLASWRFWVGPILAATLAVAGTMLVRSIGA